MSEIERITHLLQETFAGQPYHGPSVLGALENVTADVAARKPPWSAHTIWDIVAHLTAELTYARQVLEGTAGPWDTTLTWPAVTDTSPAAWEGALQDLKQANQALVLAVEQLDDAVLDRQPMRVRGPFYVMLHGTIHHNVHHAGQLSLLRGQMSPEHNDYYLARQPELLADFDHAARRWRAILSPRYADEFVDAVLKEARARFAALIPQLPYIGGDDNHLTRSLIGSACCLAFYQAMQARNKSAAEAGQVLYDAIQAHPEDFVPQIHPSQRLTREELMARRRAAAQRSQERRYAWDWVYEFVAGDGERFDYGYDFVECATQKLYRAHGALEFLPFYCFLDFPKCELGGLGLSRTVTLAEGGAKCDHRFKVGGKSTQAWPPPFLRGGER
jgi:hypothetical protein